MKVVESLCRCSIFVDSSEPIIKPTIILASLLQNTDKQTGGYNLYSNRNIKKKESPMLDPYPVMVTIT